MSTRPELSVLIPVYDEAAALPTLFERLAAALEGVTDDYEILVVDDGSRDDSQKIVEARHREDPRVVSISLSRNFGKEAAILAGYDHARGRAIVVMDADLQNPPELIPELVARWRGGDEIVETVRTSVGGQSWLREKTSSAFYWLISRVGDLEMTPHASDFRLLDGRVVDYLRRCRERSRFNRGLVQWLGFRRSQVEYSAPSRQDGRSRWSFLHLVVYALDAIVAFSPAPLRLAGLGGLALSILSFGYLVVVAYIRFAHGVPLPGYATLVGGIFLLGGVQLTTIWVLGEYIARISQEVKQRPEYVVRETLGVSRTTP